MTTALASFSNFNQLNNNYDYSLFLVFRDPDDEGEVWCEAGAGAGGDQSAQVWSSSQQGKTTILEIKQSVHTLTIQARCGQICPILFVLFQYFFVILR